MGDRRAAHRRRAAAALCALAAAAAVVAPAPAARAVPAVPAVPAAPPASPASPGSLALLAYDRMSTAQRVGQLFMLGVATSGPSAGDLRTLTGSHVGNVYLAGPTTAGIAGVARTTARLRGELTQAGVRPFLGTDQEGGEVQRLHGPGFSEMPTGLAQGALSPPALQRDTRTWGGQLIRAGVNLDLAPVADTVPRSVGTSNQPIGAFYREYGYTVDRVRTHVVAAVRGFRASGVAATLKHFPGLGQASGNTDVTREVTAPTTAHSTYLWPFYDGIAAGAQFVMVSSARYPAIDRWHLACFSPTVIRTLLRRQERFGGIVVSDSFSAAALDAVPVGERAVRFLAAGGTMVLDSGPQDVHSMVAGVLAQMAHDPAFAATVRADVLLVLTAKARDHLL